MRNANGQTYQNRKVDYSQMFQDALDNLGMVSRKQLELMAESLISAEFPYFTLNKEVLARTVENYINHSNTIVQKEQVHGDAEDIIYVNGVNKPRYEIIPCIWALYNFFPLKSINLHNIIRGNRDETIVYTVGTTRYVFYYINEENLAKMPETIKHSKYLNENANLKETDAKKFKIISFYVTDRVFIADEIEKFNIPYEYNLAVLKTGDYRFAEPEKVIFMKNGERIK